SNTGNQRILARDKIAAAARLAPAAVSAVPANTDTLSHCPLRNIGTDRVHLPDNFMPRHTGISDERKQTTYRDGIAVADTACLYPHPHFASLRFRDFARNLLQRRARFFDLNISSI